MNEARRGSNRNRRPAIEMMLSGVPAAAGMSDLRVIS